MVSREATGSEMRVSLTGADIGGAKGREEQFGPVHGPAGCGIDWLSVDGIASADWPDR